METKVYILSGQDKGKSFDTGFREFITIGRSSLCDIQLNDSHVSRFHLEIRKKGLKYFIMDLGSKNGTFINGKDIRPEMGVSLKEGVPVVVGKTVIGLGEVCETYLKSFFDSAGICEGVNPEKRCRAKAVKKNLNFIYDMNNILKASRDINELAEKILDSVFNLFKRIDRCVIVLVDADTLKVSEIKYRSREPVEDPKRIYNRELVQKALLLNKPVIISNAYKEADEDDKITESLRLMNIGSAMCVPICTLSKTKGAVYVDSLKKPNGFRINDLALLKDVCNRTAIAMDNISLNEAIGLYNHH